MLEFLVPVYIIVCISILDIYADTDSKRVKENNDFSAEVAHTPANRLKRRIEEANNENKTQDGKYIANILCPSNSMLFLNMSTMHKVYNSICISGIGLRNVVTLVVLSVVFLVADFMYLCHSWNKVFSTFLFHFLTHFLYSTSCRKHNLINSFLIIGC